MEQGKEKKEKERGSIEMIHVLSIIGNKANLKYFRIGRNFNSGRVDDVLNVTSYSAVTQSPSAKFAKLKCLVRKVMSFTLRST